MKRIAAIVLICLVVAVVTSMMGCGKLLQPDDVEGDWELRIGPGQEDRAKDYEGVVFRFGPGGKEGFGGFKILYNDESAEEGMYRIRYDEVDVYNQDYKLIFAFRMEEGELVSIAYEDDVLTRKVD